MDRFRGCLLGLALGDALGAPLEGGPIERLLWRLIGKTGDGHMRWTDDTQMSLDLAESLLARHSLVPDDVARRFAASYRWSRGYGPGTARVLKCIARGIPWQQAAISVYPQGSFGNGAAMRAPVIGLFCAADRGQLTLSARESARITHTHPRGIEGAVLIATVTAAALNGARPGEIMEAATACCREAEFLQRLDTARHWIQTEATVSAREVRRKLGNGIAAAESCVTAVYLACRFMTRPFDELLAFVAECGGDTDTIGAMAGSIWGAANGDSGLPQEHLLQLEAYAHIRDTAEALWSLAGTDLAH